MKIYAALIGRKSSIVNLGGNAENSQKAPQATA